MHFFFQVFKLLTFCFWIILAFPTAVWQMYEIRMISCSWSNFVDVLTFTISWLKSQINIVFTSNEFHNTELFFFHSPVWNLMLFAINIILLCTVMEIIPQSSIIFLYIKLYNPRTLAWFCSRTWLSDLFTLTVCRVDGWNWHYHDAKIWQNQHLGFFLFWI